MTRYGRRSASGPSPALFFFLYLSVVRSLLCLFVLLLLLLGWSWRDAAQQLDPVTSRAGRLMLAYTLIQGCFDLSLLHWPVTLVITGIALGIPLCVNNFSPEKITSNNPGL